jgi:hypothetical protein
LRFFLFVPSEVQPDLG